MAKGSIVLVIDRDHDTRVRLRQKLESAGHVVVSVTSGFEALGIIDKITTPTLIMLNTNLVGMSAEQFLSALSQLENFKHVPVSQISSAVVPRIQGTCCIINSFDLDHILEWLDTSKVQSDWVMSFRQ